MVSRKRQSRAKGRRNKSTQPSTRSVALVPRAPAMQRIVAKPKVRRARGVPNITDAGLAFLKCAFASPDFSVDPGKGIPDEFRGRTLAIKDCNTTSLSFTPNTDTYIIVAPVPGYAYFRAEVPIGTDPTTFTGVPYPTYSTNFGSGTAAFNNFSKFRYSSLSAGMYPTSNMMQFSGSIQVWRIDLNLAESQHAALATTTSSGLFVQKNIIGLRGVRALAPRDNYSGNFIDGAYTYAFDATTDFEWHDFFAAAEFTELANTVPILPTTRRLNAAGASQPLVGLGNTNTLVFKVSTPTGAVNTTLFRTWNCVELQPNTDSSLFQFSGTSPPLDPTALMAYHELKMSFPVAVPVKENANFWKNVLNSLKIIIGAGAKFIPGPLGLVATGVHGLMGGLY